MIRALSATYRNCEITGLAEKARALSDYVAQTSLSAYVILETCNRVELYSTQDAGLPGFRKMTGQDAVRHLFRVACGLDSMLLGENEILCQVKKACQKAVSDGHCYQELTEAFSSAIRLGSRVRSKTGITDGKTSIASLAVDYALTQREYPAESVLVVGSGSMGAKIACALKNRGVKQIFLANRRRERALRLAEKVGGVVADFRMLRSLLESSSIVFTATSAPHVIIRRETVPAGKRTLFLDLGVPPDVSSDVEGIGGIKVLRLAHFREVAEKNSLSKAREALKAEAMIEEALLRFTRVRHPPEHRLSLHDAAAL